MTTSENHTGVFETDICIYGGTSAGIAAALAAARSGKSVVIAESSTHLGGLTTGGLGATDIGSKAAVGGIAREFYERVHEYYARPESWTWSQPEQSVGTAYEAQNDPSNPDPIAEKTGRPTKWTFEPHIASKIFRAMLDESAVPVYFGQRLAEVQKEGARIVALCMENGNVFRAKYFIDASYEGDLMARAGVSYHVGRESNATYSETLNGVRGETPHHQFSSPVDPYLEPGNPSSGLLPFIQEDELGAPGEGDACVQAYNFRLCLTQVPENRVLWSAPPDYDERDYELLARHIEAREKAGQPLKALGWGGLMNPVVMPNGKTDSNNSGAFSTDFIGGNYEYPDGDCATRERVWKEHEYYTRGFLYFLATSERVPQRIRDEMSTWGLAKDEFIETDNWPPQLYVREARRMISDYVINENDCVGNRSAEDGVGLAAYQMDSHNCRRFVQDGLVKNEGDVQRGVEPFPVSYRSIVPKKNECENLSVPVCMAASHIAFGSIRMEPVFMILGQSAATAAVLGLETGCSAQEISYDELRKQLERDGQILTSFKYEPGA
jgi:hypothetical protein